MSLYRSLREREAKGEPVRVGLVGAGKFGAMFLAQARKMAGVHIVGIADLEPERARLALAATGWATERVGAADVESALRTGGTWLTDDTQALIEAPDLDILVEATGSPRAGIAHALAAFTAGRHVVMVNVEADALAGPLLARRAAEAGVIYSLAWGDQPALICEHVDWARTCGFEVVCAGKGTRYLPRFHQSTPETVWEAFGITAEVAARGGMNPQMFTSFIDGSKSAIEMTAVANATGLVPQAEGLGFPPAACRELAEVCRPRAKGGQLSRSGTTEVVSSLCRDGTEIEDHLTLGTYVVVAADHDYVSRCLGEYGFSADREQEHFALWRPAHFIGLELGISIASIACRQEPTGCADAFRSDVVAVAKRALRVGEVLDGEGGFSVWGRQLPAATSLERGGLPIGLARGLPLVREVEEGALVRWDDVESSPSDEAVLFRREMERQCFEIEGPERSETS